MAHLRSCEYPCIYPGCHRPAKKILVNNKNAEIGRYCVQHAGIRLREISELEEKERAKK